MNQNSWRQPPTQEQTKLKPWILPSDKPTADVNSSRLDSLATGFSSIDLQEMDAVALLDRFDTKYLLSSDQLIRAFSTLQTEYRVLSVGGQRLNHYRTLYFDTSDFALYNLHVNDRAERFKVRSREYIDSHQSFLEVKHRTRKDRTIKNRIPTELPVVWFNAGNERWLKGVFPYDSRELESKLWNTFTRITLVHKVCCERVTIDLNLVFYTARRVVQLDGIAVAEVKRDGVGCRSAFMTQMHALRVRPQGFSKYCVGAALLYDRVKKNSLKDKLLWLERNSCGVDHE